MLLRKLLSAGWPGLAFLGLAGVVLWLQATSNPVDAAPEVKIVHARTSAEVLAPSDVLTITAALRNDGGPLRNQTVELEIRGDDGRLALRAPRRGVQLDSSQEQAVSWVWRLPTNLAAGQYTVDISVYGTNWSPLYARLEGGASFVVQQRR